MHSLVSIMDYDLEELQRECETYRQTLQEIKKIIQNIPPSYAYGDNEAACYMAGMLEDIDNLIP